MYPRPTSSLTSPKRPAPREARVPWECWKSSDGHVAFIFAVLIHVGSDWVCVHRCQWMLSLQCLFHTHFSTRTQPIVPQHSFRLAAAFLCQVSVVFSSGVFEHSDKIFIRHFSKKCCASSCTSAWHFCSVQTVHCTSVHTTKKYSHSASNRAFCWFLVVLTKGFFSRLRARRPRQCPNKMVRFSSPWRNCSQASFPHSFGKLAMSDVSTEDVVSYQTGEKANLKQRRKRWHRETRCEYADVQK